ncbi:HDOD domain-containing protein [Cognatilysobacter bugurensis]|uniref:HDOD domain-containing protein n=1 Tax=Cognatilysobacter bugurensis TaxID=543356 RepID=A0A918W8E5_9GAMM|nr:HDOD domain-containing protein [Lysobacter bugurensis]GHA80482.1 hypothetical protein GCM10007067_17860 [Lysobacter bugurensis]
MPASAAAADAQRFEDSSAGLPADQAAVEVDVEVLSAATLLARLRAHALGDALPDIAGDGSEHRDVRARTAAALARLDAQPERIPRRPQLLPALMRATGSGDAPVKAIAALVQQDPTLTGNVLRVANSAAYRVAGKPIESVERAIARLGSEGMRRIVAATLLQPVTDTRRGAFAGFAPVAWTHSLAAATAAAEYVAHEDPELASTAHLAALVHGLGGIVVVQCVRDEYARRPLLMPDPGVAAALLDEAGATGARIAAAWELPGSVLQALTVVPEPGASPLVRALWIGRLVGAAAVLVRADRLDVASAVATLARLDDGRARAGAVLQRLLDDGGESA